MNWFKKKKEYAPLWATTLDGDIVDGWKAVEKYIVEAGLDKLNCFEDLDIICVSRIGYEIHIGWGYKSFRPNILLAALSIDPVTGKVKDLYAKAPVATLCNKLIDNDEKFTYEFDTIRYKGAPVLWQKGRWNVENEYKYWTPSFELSEVEVVLVDKFTCGWVSSWKAKENNIKRDSLAALLDS